ncbi:AbiTii domain-containing protein [Nocardia gipuzkoensis]
MSGSYVLENLRRRVINESEPLAGLLRTCLLLGAETGSDALRAWASAELHGYAPQDTLPKYRQLQLPLSVDGWIGTLHRSGYSVDSWHLQQEDRDKLQSVPFQQSVEELERLAAATNPLQYKHDVISLAGKRAEGLPFTRVEQAYCVLSPATVAGIVGKIRTTLVEMVADMTRDVPFDGLPSRSQVDSAVQVNLHGSQDQYHVNVHNNSGVIGQGAGSSQTQHVTNNSQDLADLLAQLRTAIAEIDNDDDRADAEQTVDDFEEAINQENPEPEAVRSRWRAVRRLGAVVGGALGQAVSSEAATAAIDGLTSVM